MKMNTKPLILSTLLVLGMCLGIARSASATDSYVSSKYYYYDDYPEHISFGHDYVYPRHSYRHGHRYGHYKRHHGKRHHKHHYDRYYGKRNHRYDHHARHYR